MGKILEKWIERHCTEDDSIVGNYHYIEHIVYIGTNGDIIHERNIFKWDDCKCNYKLSDTIEVVLQKGV